MDSPFVIDLDFTEATNDIPFWLRDVFDRALNATGIKRRRSASDEAISSLIKVDPSKNKECPICYEAFDVETTQSQPVEPILYRNEDFCQKLLQYGIHKESNEKSFTFNDPMMFFPTDPGGQLYSRYPQRLLTAISTDDQFPGFDERDKKIKDKRIEQFKQEGHIAVQMPECDHVFGLSCIVEWLKSNVSCPLCRKEVEAKSHDLKKIKREYVENIILHNYNNEGEMLEHILESTDVFHPFRRPYNPSITPVTDSYMQQNWCTPYTNDSNVEERTKNPDIVLPRKFPFAEPSSSRVFPLRRTTTRTVTRTRDVRPRNNSHSETRTDSENEDQRRRSVSSESRSTRRVNFSPHTTNIDDLSS